MTQTTNRIRSLFYGFSPNTLYPYREERVYFSLFSKQTLQMNQKGVFL